MSGEHTNHTESKISTQEPTLAVYTGMNEVFEHTRLIIDNMKQGEKIGIRDLADKVAAQVDKMSSGNVMNLVQLFCKQSKEVSVEVGRGGGVFKGGKPRRVDARPRCPHCNQVVRTETKNKEDIDQSNMVEHQEI